MKESGNGPLMLGVESRGGGEGKKAGKQGWHLRNTCLSGEGLKIPPWADEGWGALKGLPLLGCWWGVDFTALPEESELSAV